MLLSILGILVLGALISTIVSIMGKCPLYVPVLLLSIIVGLQVLPLGD